MSKQISLILLYACSATISAVEPEASRAAVESVTGTIQTLEILDRARDSFERINSMDVPLNLGEEYILGTNNPFSYLHNANSCYFLPDSEFSV